jgi:hypothetical protein
MALLPTTHADGTNEIIHASTINDIADAVNKIGPSFSLSNYATGDGVTDDQAGITAALAAAGSTGVVTSPPGKTYLIASRITVSTSGARLDLNGSTIKKKSTMTTDAINVTGTTSASATSPSRGTRRPGRPAKGSRGRGRADC